MIKLIDNLDDYDFSSFENDIFFQRIYSDYKSYSSFDDALFYVSVSENTVNAVFSKVNGDVTISLLKEADFYEINEFLSVLGYCVILCEDKYSEHFTGEKTSGNILKITVDEKQGCKAEMLYSENLKDMYSLIENVFSYKSDFMIWFADMSHKIRHKSASLCGIYEDDKLVSAAFSLFETENSAVISSVATLEKYRNNGYATEIVNALLSKNSKKHVYVFTENENIDKWYKKIGFTEHKKWSEIKNVL